MLNHYKRETQELCRVKGWDKADISTVWLLLTEEIGELASAIRQATNTFKKTGLKKERGQDLMMEMTDVLSYLFQIAGMLNLDLDLSWQQHRKKLNTKKYVSLQ
jgi:NTP pyrophosphatase (non-canonical NTP hydrolase)